MVCVLEVAQRLGGIWADLVLGQALISLEVWTALKDGFEVLLI